MQNDKTGKIESRTGPVVLVSEGQGRAVVFLPKDPHQRERQAADEIIAYVEKISGARLELAHVSSAGQALDQAQGKVGILVGSLALADGGGPISTEDVEAAQGDRPNTCYEPDGFVLSAEPGVIALAGVRPAGTLYGAVELLERLGCRWFFPGELGEVVPKSRTVAVAPGKTIQAPSFEYRYFWGVFANDDKTRKRFKKFFDILEPWHVHSKSSFADNALEYGHNFRIDDDISDPKLLEDRIQQALDFFKENPQSKRHSLGWEDCYCDVDEDAALGIMHRWDKRYSASDPLISFCNKIAEKVTDVYPDKELGVLAYMNYIIPPVSVEPHRALMIAVAPIEQCGRHIGNTGTCWQRDATLAAIKGWCEMSDKVILFDYDPQFLTHGSMPVPAVRRLQKEMPLMHAYGLRGVITCAQLSVMMQGPNNYVRTKLLWNIDADVEALLEEYYRGLFGPAAQNVRQFTEALEDMMLSLPGHQHEDEIMKVVYPIEKVQPLEEYVKQAQAKADTDILRRRVQIIRYCYDDMMTYLAMRQAEDRAQFGQAARLAGDLIQLQKEIVEFDSVIYQPGSFPRQDEEEVDFLPYGWRRQNEQRQACIDGTRGDLVAMLPEAWQFTTDPHDEGIIFRWFKPEHDSSNWRSIKVTCVWEPQGLEDDMGHGYDGVGWYRTEADVPADFAGRAIKLNFGGVFGRMLVWVNGCFIAYHPFKRPYYAQRYCQNFDIDVTEAAAPGAKNTVIIRVDNEIEWGGIYRRVFLWSPVG